MNGDRFVLHVDRVSMKSATSKFGDRDLHYDGTKKESTSPHMLLAFLATRNDERGCSPRAGTLFNQAVTAF